MSKSDRRELESRLSTIMQHLLKLEYLPHLFSYNQRIWKNTIGRERGNLLALLGDRKPGLKPQLNEELVYDAYEDALAEVVAEFPQTEFPQSCPYVVDQVVGKEISELLTR